MELSTSMESSSGSGLKKNSVSFYGLLGFTLAGVLAIIGPIEIASFIGDTGPAAIWPIILGYVLFVLVSFPILEYTRIAPFGGGAGSQSRLMWAMTRDGFVKSKRLNRLNSSRSTPTNAAAFDSLLAGITVMLVGLVMVYFYGYTPSTVADCFYVGGTASTILWYFHHFIPEFGLFTFLGKHKELKFSQARRYVSGLIIPVAGGVLFVYTFYLGIISDLVEPYLAFVVLAVLILIAIIVYTIYKKIKGELGNSTVEYMMAETGDVDDSK